MNSPVRTRASFVTSAKGFQGTSFLLVSGFALPPAAWAGAGAGWMTRIVQAAAAASGRRRRRARRRIANRMAGLRTRGRVPYSGRARTQQVDRAGGGARPVIGHLIPTAVPFPYKRRRSGVLPGAVVLQALCQPCFG